MVTVVSYAKAQWSCARQRSLCIVPKPPDRRPEHRRRQRPRCREERHGRGSERDEGIGMALDELPPRLRHTQVITVARPDIFVIQDAS